MITADLVSAVVLATVPVAAALGALTLTQLVIVATLQGAASVLHDAAAISLLPGLSWRSRPPAGRAAHTRRRARRGAGGRRPVSEVSNETSPVAPDAPAPLDSLECAVLPRRRWSPV